VHILKGELGTWALLANRSGQLTALRLGMGVANANILVPCWDRLSVVEFTQRVGSCRAQLLSVRSTNSSKTLSGTLHPSLFAFSTSFLCTRLKSLNALSLRAVVIGNLFR
jgi:hypothetical protein